MEDRAGKRSVTDNFERQNKPKIQKFNDRRKKSFEFSEYKTRIYTPEFLLSLDTVSTILQCL